MIAAHLSDCVILVSADKSAPVLPTDGGRARPVHGRVGQRRHGEAAQGDWTVARIAQEGNSWLCAKSYPIRTARRMLATR